MNAQRTCSFFIIGGFVVVAIVGALQGQMESQTALRKVIQASIVCAWITITFVLWRRVCRAS
jgi:hypothetical protein